MSSDWIAAYNIFVSICMYRFFSESDCRMRERERENMKWMRTEAKVYMYTSSIFTDIHVASVRVSRRGWVRLSSRTIHSNCTDIALNLKPTAVRVIEIVNDFTQMTRGFEISKGINVSLTFQSLHSSPLTFQTITVDAQMDEFHPFFLQLTKKLSFTIF